MLIPLLAAAVTLLGSYLYGRLRYTRLKKYAGFPQPPPSLLWGHLNVVNEYLNRGKPKMQADMAFVAMNKDLGRPPFIFLDMRPVGPAMLVVKSHEVAEQISKPTKDFPYSVPKYFESYNHISHMTGPTSILSSRGEHWKTLRKRFNPGFANQHLMTFLPVILEKSFPFIDHLDRLAKSGDTFRLVHYTANLTFDIITSVTMNVDFAAQETMDNPSDFMRTYHALFETYAGEQISLPWYLTPVISWKRQRLSNRLRRILRKIVYDAFAERQQQAQADTNGTGKSAKSRSILALSLKDIDSMTTHAVDEACDQLNTFLFAGHDTTSVFLAFTFYELQRTPRALKALRDELDELFGTDSDPRIVRDRLLSEDGQDIMRRMTYTSAVIKEGLRLWPPGATIRELEPGTTLNLHTSSGDYVLRDVSVYDCVHMVQRDPDVYGETADEFVPERWIGEAADKIPTPAWRAFGRGPRNCIGQELANIEARVILALVARRYDFVKEGIGAFVTDAAGEPVLDGDKGRYKVEEEIYPALQVTPTPVDGMVVKVKRR